MSFPYITDLMFGSEMSSVGGNLPSRVVNEIKEEGGGGSVPVETAQVFQSNKANCVKVIDNDPVDVQEAKCYYVCDISSIEEGEDKDTLREVLSKLEITVTETIHTGDTFSSSNNLLSVLSEMGISPSDWSISVSNRFDVTMYAASCGSVGFSFYLEGDPEPIMVSTMDDIYLEYVSDPSTVDEGHKIVEERTFTFKAIK